MKTRLYLTPEPVLTDVVTGLPHSPDDFPTLRDIPNVVNHDGYTSVVFVATRTQAFAPLRDTFGEIIRNYSYAAVLQSNGAIIGAWFARSCWKWDTCNWIPA